MCMISVKELLSVHAASQLLQSLIQVVTAARELHDRHERFPQLLRVKSAGCSAERRRRSLQRCQGGAKTPRNNVTVTPLCLKQRFTFDIELSAEIWSTGFLPTSTV